MLDYIACILIRVLGPIIRASPTTFVFFLGARLGKLIYHLDKKHRAIAYANIKVAFGGRLLPKELIRITKGFYRNLAQAFIEMFLIPSVGRRYLDKYIAFEGMDNIASAFKQGKGVILLMVHQGSWEISNIVSANLGYPFNILVRDQARLPRLNRLLNFYRAQKGTKLIHTKNQTRELIEALKRNEAIGMTVDQGGKAGELVEFFGRHASMATGAIRLSLKHGATIVPVFSVRLRGPRIKFIIEPPFEIKKTGDEKEDVRNNLQRLIAIFEKYIVIYPEEYLWTYRVWKYTRQQNILVLSDGKAGHLRQAETVVRLVNNYFKDNGVSVNIKNQEVKFKNRFSKDALALGSCFGAKYYCQGCLWCLKTFLEKDTYQSLLGLKPDIIISSGSSLAPVNFVVSKENLAKSIVVMRPGILSTKKFDLVIMSRHDHPPERKNVVVTEGALNLIDEEYLKEQSDKIVQATGYRLQATGLYIGLLIGGDTKDFRLQKDTVLEVVRQVKQIAKKTGANILATTSRRTSKNIEEAIKGEFKDYPGCKLLVIANEKNIPEAVGGILGLSKFVVTSPESISMISEAASAGRYTIVFESKVDCRHRRFLNYMANGKYIYLCRPDDLFLLIDKLCEESPRINTLKDAVRVGEALRRII